MQEIAITHTGPNTVDADDDDNGDEIALAIKRLRSMQIEVFIKHDTPPEICCNW